MRKVLFALFVAGILLISAKAYADDDIAEFKFWASEDAYVQQNSNEPTWSDTNYGFEDYLRVRDLNSLTYPNTLSRTFLKVSGDDLSQLTGLDIISASLHLYEWYRAPGSSSADEINLFRVTDDWSEDTITWNNQAGHADKRLTHRTFDSGDTTPGWRSWQDDALKNLVTAWLDGSKNNYGLMLENDLDGQLNEMNVKFRSSEYLGGTSIYRPYLKITATPEPLAVVLFVLGGTCLSLAAARRKRKALHKA